MSIDVQFTEEDWQRVDESWAAWWAGELDRPLVTMSTVDPARAANLPQAPRFVAQLPIDMPVDEVLDRYEAAIGAGLFFGDAWPKWWPNFGPGIVAGFLGCRVNVDDRTVWFTPPDDRPIDQLHLRYDPDNPWLVRIRELVCGAVERWGDKISVAFTDLGGNMDVLASFRTTERLLLDLYDAPQEVDRLVRQITGLWLRYYDEFCEIITRAGRGTTPWAPIRSTKRCYMTQCDFSYMISPEMFERFVLPDLDACCRHMEHGFYHLDGKGQLAHLDLLCELESLKGIQWVPGDGAPTAANWPDVLGRIRDAGKLCQIWATRAEAIGVVSELGGKGFTFDIHNAPRSQDEADAFMKQLSDADKLNPGWFD